MFIDNLTSFYVINYKFVLTCTSRSTSYENVKKSCNGRIWWRNTQEILVIPVPLHVADLNLSIVNIMVSFEIFPEPLDQSKPNQMGLWIGCILIIKLWFIAIF